MQAALVDIDAILQANERAVLTPGLRGDASELREIAREMKTALKQIVSPYLEAALENALGNKEGARRYNDMILASMKTDSDRKTAIENDPENYAENGTAADSTEVIPDSSGVGETEQTEESTVDTNQDF